MDTAERDIYAAICRADGIKAREIASQLDMERTVVNRYLYISPYMRELCYRDRDYRWHGLICQKRPHRGLGDFSGYYSTVGEFLETDEKQWFDNLLSGCRKNGRNLNDTRGLFHSFRDTGTTMRSFFHDLIFFAADTIWAKMKNWEIVFELRIKKAKYIRIYADVLVITDRYVFSLEFKMKDKIEREEVSQAAKYCSYLEIIFGPGYDIIPVLVLTKARDLYQYEPMAGSTAEVPVCSGDMLFNVVDEYMGLLEE